VVLACQHATKPYPGKNQRKDKTVIIYIYIYEHGILTCELRNANNKI